MNLFSLIEIFLITFAAFGLIWGIFFNSLEIFIMGIISAVMTLALLIYVIINPIEAE